MIFFGQKCVLCMFYIEWSLEGRKNFRVGIYFEEKLVRVGLQETNFFFRPKYCSVTLLIAR